MSSDSSITEEKERMIQVALDMYRAAAMMPDTMHKDANSIAAKAKTLMNKGLEGVIDFPTNIE